MAKQSSRPKRKVSGSRYIDYRKKKLYELKGSPTLTKLSPLKRSSERIIGGNQKIRLLKIEEANVYDPKSKKHKLVKIKTVVDNPANRQFVRRNILTKGAIIETELGKARITSRPGQEGTLNAILI